MIKPTTENVHWSRVVRKLVLFVIVALSPLMMGANGCLPTEATDVPDDPVSFCSRAGAYWCNTSIVPQTLTAQGWNGYCMVGNTAATTANYSRGYSGVTGTGGATPVYPSSQQAWNEGCGASSFTGRGVCNSVVTCTRN
jgi:hypothetical protein